MAFPSAAQIIKSQRRASIALYRTLGLGCVAIGFINYAIPGLPSTVFFLVALWAFKRSSPRLEAWLLNHKLIGPPLRDWEESRSLTVRTKIVAISALWLGIGTSVALIHKVWLQVLLLVIATLVTTYLLTRNTKK